MPFQKLTLDKPWLDFDAGAEVEVDPERAAWLRANGYERVPEPPAKPEVKQGEKKKRREV